jgi:mannose-6-phosphate isomerase-like protein (cupin superfamily)
MKTALKIAALLAFAIPVAALSGDRTTVFIAQDVRTELVRLAPEAQAKGSSGSTLMATGNLALKTSVRTSSGGAEIHAHYDDLMIVEQGSATLITGGTVVDAKTDANGETKGPRIEGGVSRTIHVGDVVIVPAGEPHQLLIAPGTLYSALVAKIKEAGNEGIGTRNEGIGTRD